LLSEQTTKKTRLPYCCLAMQRCLPSLPFKLYNFNIHYILADYSSLIEVHWSFGGPPTRSESNPSQQKWTASKGNGVSETEHMRQEKELRGNQWGKRNLLVLSEVLYKHLSWFPLLLNASPSHWPHCCTLCLLRSLIDRPGLSWSLK
jgi:hypothetical protein